MAAYRRVDDLTVTCRLIACTPGSAPGPTLGVEYGKPLSLSFYILTIHTAYVVLLMFCKRLCHFMFLKLSLYTATMILIFNFLIATRTVNRPPFFELHMYMCLYYFCVQIKRTIVILMTYIRA